MKIKEIALFGLFFLLAWGMIFTVTAEASPPFGGEGPPGQREDFVPPGQEKKQIDSEDNGEENGDNEEKWIPPGLRDKETPPGLEDKGGLPPGLHDRDTLPPGIQMRFRHTIQQLDTRIDDIAIEGKDAVAIPPEESEPYEYEYKIITLNRWGDEVDAVDADDWDVEINEEENEEKISISKNGALTLEVESGAIEGSLTITASYTLEYEDEEKDDTTLSDTLTVELYEPEKNSLQIKGSDYIGIHESENGTITEDYSAVFLDQHGNEIENGEVNWEVSTEDAFKDLEIDEGSITFEVDDNLLEKLEADETCTLTVNVSCEENEDLTGEKDVTVYMQYPDSITVSGAETITIPEGDDPETKTYEAKIVDEYGYEIENEDIEVTWLLNPSDEELDAVTLDQDKGELSVSSDAEEQTIELSAVYEINDEDDLDGSIEIKIVNNNDNGE